MEERPPFVVLHSNTVHAIFLQSFEKELSGKLDPHSPLDALLVIPSVGPCWQRQMAKALGAEKFYDVFHERCVEESVTVEVLRQVLIAFGVSLPTGAMPH